MISLTVNRQAYFRQNHNRNCQTLFDRIFFEKITIIKCFNNLKVIFGANFCIADYRSQ